jgi:hypothetical protein
MEFLTSTAFLAIAVPTVSFLGVVGLYFLFKWLKLQKQGYPGEAAIEAALLPYFQQAIMFAYRLNEQVGETLNRKLSGTDKKRIADQLYSLLPDKIDVMGVMIPTSILKALISPLRFSQLIQFTFDVFLDFYNDANEVLEDELQSILV